MIFGATGDLAHRNLVPALYNLATGKLLPEKRAVVGFARSARDEGEFRQSLRAVLAVEGTCPRDDLWNSLAGQITDMSGGYDVESFRRLAAALAHSAATAGPTCC